MQTTTTERKLEEFAFEIRKDLIYSLAAAGSGHLGGSLGLADIFTVLYFHTLRHKADRPQWTDRDRLILSIGHVAPVLYTTLAHAGYFPKTELSSLRQLGSRLQGHPGREHGLPGIELSAGSLGQGLSVAVGMALAAKINQKDHHIFCINGDGELQEGSIWEAAMSAAHHKLDNLIAIVDLNGLQIDGPTQKVMNLDPLDKKWESFGWKVLKCNGNKIPELITTLKLARQIQDQPIVILAQTKMGKGIPAIENDYHWHGKAPKADDVTPFIEALRTTYKHTHETHK